MRVRAIAFDLDNTLWDVEPVIVRAERLAHDWLSEHCPRIAERFSLEAMRSARERLAREEPERAHDLTYLRTAALARHARECGYAEQVAEQAFGVFFAARNQLEPFIDVRPALEKLRRSYALASLTNGNADLTMIGIADLFALSLSARQIGAAKPHAMCFEHLARGLRLEPREILYVGDDPVIDVAAGREAGLKVAWMNRRRSAWPKELEEPDLVIRDCHELATALGGA